MSWTWYFSSRVIVAILLILLLKIVVVIVPVPRVGLLSPQWIFLDKHLSIEYPGIV